MRVQVNPKFVQIFVVKGEYHDSIYALDETGIVWIHAWTGKKRVWKQLPTERDYS